eukprot:jgi/Astpho2/8341/Aster-x1515
MERRFAATACAAALLTVWVFTVHPFIKERIRLHNPWERDPDPYEGRAAIHHPVPQCCSGQSCLKQDSGRHAVMTTVRSQYYMMGFRELHCSLEHSNPGLQLIVLGVEGDLPPKDVEEIKSKAEWRPVEDIKLANKLNPRFGLNWVKLRAWEQSDLDAIIMVDTDMVILQDLSHLFSLPTDFAIAYAEQSFLDWFFKYTAWHLPMEYNMNFAFLNNNATLDTKCSEQQQSIPH